MSRLIQLKISEAPDHKIVYKPWLYDLMKFQCEWTGGSNEFQWIQIDLASHTRYIVLKFTGVRDVYIPVEETTSSIAIKVLDMSMYIPEVPAPIRVEHPKGGGLSFWASTVDLLYEINETGSE